MTRPTRIPPLAALLAAATLLLAAASRAATPSGYFEDGNRLLDDDLYYAALLRYRQAADAGFDTPLLHFNSGVAHYRAGQHVRAREAFMRALAAPGLEPLAQYNLGLNAGRADDTPSPRKTPRVVTTREPSPLSLNARISFGVDSNPFRAPSAPFVDYSDPAEPVIVPVEQASAFMPVTLGARYQVNAYENEGFFGAYRLDGRYYQDQEIESANEYLHELSFGSEYFRRDEERDRERRLYSAFRIGQRDQVYYDRNDGEPRFANDVDVSDRFRYVRYGPELAFRQFNGRLGFGIRGRAELWNYERVEEVPEYDHEFLLLGTFAQYAFSPTSLLRLKLTGYARRFGDRRSRAADGSLDIDNDALTYNYLEGTITARQRIGERFWFGVEYERRQREDTFVGYADYTRDSYGAEFRWGIGNRFDLEILGHYRLYNFPNAFAFHDPAQGVKTLEALDVSTRISYRMTPSLFLVIEASMDDQASTDSRLEFGRNQFVLGVHWEP